MLEQLTASVLLWRQIWRKSSLSARAVLHNVHLDFERGSLVLNRRLTLRCIVGVKRGGRGSGLPVDPIRVREARLEAGLSLAQLAGDDVSRTFIHFVERGRSRPSKAVLSLIARRTGKPISYFMLQATSENQSGTGLAAEITQVAKRIRGFVAVTRLTEVEQQAMKLVELTMLQGAELTRSVEKKRDRVKDPS